MCRLEHAGEGSERLTMVTMLWVIFDIIAVLVGLWFMGRPLRRKEKIAIAGFIFARIGIAVYGGNSEREDAERMAALQQQVTDLSKGQAFNTGQLSAIGQLSAKTLEFLASKSDANPKAGPDAIVHAASAKIDQLERELAKMKEHRHLSEAEKGEMRRALATKPAGTFLLQFNIGDQEAYEYAAELQQMLLQAGWHERKIPGLPGGCDYPFSGLWIVYHLGSAPQDATTLRDAFDQCNIKVHSGYRDFVTPEEQWMLIVGTKPEN